MQRDTTTQTFYTRTVNALDAKQLSDEKAASKLRTIKDTYKDGRASTDTTDAASGGASKGDAAAQKPLKDVEAGREAKTEADVAEVKVDDVGTEDEDTAADSKAPYKKTEKEKEKGGEGSEEKSVAGRKKMKNPKNKEERLVEAELNQILKRSPSEPSPHRSTNTCSTTY